VVDDYLEQPSVTGLSIMDKQTQVTISKLPLDYTLVHDIFKSVANHNLNVDMISVISNSSLNVSFTIIEDEKHHFQKALSDVLQDLPKLNIKYYSGYSKISIVGIGMKSSRGVAAEYFEALKEIPVKLVTTSEIKISCLVEEQYKEQAMNALIKMFEL
jgi:aspartate kinase